MGATFMVSSLFVSTYAVLKSQLLPLVVHMDEFTGVICMNHKTGTLCANRQAHLFVAEEGKTL